ncbi:MBL fold metallo-hydrolase [Variovorax sp. PBL-E5]|uniref:MBL fold metallo-hydrolase n=1 Tax=Variovorax sp. PBL-E5 TaxID=434014 RepID=UPI001316F54E|nr:MBL fold metallo-hydrolase [Variovorax sp. PBL-E5]VTU38017.1 hydroxyacylglutathione hydrolase [Variovorax sp. PBL-E5]
MTARVALPPEVVVLERGWLSSNNILFLGREKTALVDSGYATHSDQTIALVADRLGQRPLDLLFNTHLHSDHCGGNAALQVRYPRMRTRIPPGEADLVQSWDEEGLSFRATGQHCPQFRFDGLLVPGQEVILGDRTWQVHGAPGHDPHSIVLFEPQSRALISADALWEHGFGVVFPELAGEPSFAEVAATLDLIEVLAPLCVIPGHGAVFDDVAGALSEARERLEFFVRMPLKHARHALKVLMKFKLLDARSMSIGEWDGWVQGTPYLDAIRMRFFPTSTLEQLSSEILLELIRSGAASADREHIRNC